MMKNVNVKKQNDHEVMDDIIRHFVFETDSQIELLWNNDTDCSMTETKERLEAYLSYVQRETTPNIVRYLTDFGCSSSDIEKFFVLSKELENNLEPMEKRLQRCREVILKYTLSDTLCLLKNVLHDSEEDPHYSAVTADRLLKDYLICKGLKEEYSVREFLRTQGYSAADIDLFYEKYRKECLHCYFREPKEPMYSNGILKVYEVEGIFVIAILAEKENKIIDPRGAEFTADRQVKWTKKLNLVNTYQPNWLLGKTAEELQAEFGETHVFLTFGERESVPSYITNQGHLIGFVLADGKITDFVELDLLKQ